MSDGPADRDIAARLAVVRARIERAARVAGRDPAGVRLVAVSKTRSASEIRAAWDSGQRDFGENYVQELTPKHAELAELADLRWHMIGHLQTNKVRAVARLVHAVHSVDSPRLAHELGRRAKEGARSIEVFVEVNVGGEASKSGCVPGDLASILDAVGQEAALKLRGLMTVPPHTEDPLGAAPYFDAVVALRDAHGGASRMPELSMGMTHDLEVAIAHGATLVRVGTAIFGAREG